jgi:hypothetical protein
MKILKQYLSNYLSSCFPSYFPSKSDTLYSNSISNSMSSIWGTNSNRDISMVNITPLGQKDEIPLPLIGEGFDNLFLINKPSTYSKLLESFINHNGANSDKVKDLISPEMDLADRVYNIHIITGNNTQPFLHNTLKNKSSLSKLLENSNLENTSPISIDYSIDLSMVGIDRFLLD